MRNTLGIIKLSVIIKQTGHLLLSPQINLKHDTQKNRICGHNYLWKVEERLCKVCDLKTVENELHFVFDCPTYSQLRLVYYNWIIKIYPDFLSLSQTEKLKVMLIDKRVIQKSGLFIQNCFLTRTSKLFVQTDS